MSSGSSGGLRKPALCRYFVASGTCFYGDECQFVHASPNGDNAVASTALGFHPLCSSKEPCCDLPFNHDFLESIGDSSSRLDLCLPYSHQNGLLPESKLSTYIGRTPGASVQPEKVVHSSMGSSSSNFSVGDKYDAFNSSNAAFQLASCLSSLSLDAPMRVKTPNPAASEFIPRSTTPAASCSQVATGSTSSYLGFEPGVASFQSIPYSRLPPTATSPICSPRLSPEHSPLLKRGAVSPVPLDDMETFIPSPAPSFQVQQSFFRTLIKYPAVFRDCNADNFNVDGTTYFYPAGESASTSNENAGVSQEVPNYVMYPFTPAHVLHMKPKANAPSFFMPDELRLDILQRQSLTMAQVDPEQYPDIPMEVDNYHSLFPLEPFPNNPQEKSNTFSYKTSVFKANNSKTGLAYCLRRIHGYRIVYPKAMTLIGMWKKLQHSNLVQLREVFTTKSFGEHSIVFVHDYHPGAETLMAKHFSGTAAPINGLTGNSYSQGKPGKPFSHGRADFLLDAGEPRQHAGLLPESLIWAYIVQLSSVIRTIHAAGLACRTLDPTKILITGKSRLRLNCCGIYDVITFDPNQSNPLALIPHFQEDLVALGKLTLALACNSLVGLHCKNLQSSMELVARNYSSDLRNLIVYLLSNHNRPRSVNDIMPMIGARFFTQLDAAQMRNDVIENELAKEVENGRLFRLVAKLGIINERPEFSMDPSWSETGDRYMLKLFRDFLFHQVAEDGRPWIDLAHIVQCLNKLDAGITEKILLMSRDEQNVLVATYADLKHCFENSFNELLQAASQPKVT